MEKVVGISLVVGGALGKSFTGSVENARQASKRLGKEFRETNQQLGATNDLVKYRNQLQSLKEKQKSLGRSSDRLDRGIAEVSKRYKEAKRNAKAYGISVGDAVHKQKQLQRELDKTAKKRDALAKRERAAGDFGSLKGRALGAIGGAYAGFRLLNSAAALGDQEALLRTVITPEDGDRDAAVARARDHARAFSKNSLADESQLLTIQYALGSAGLEEEASRVGSELVHKLATVTRGEASVVGEVFGITFNNMAKDMEGSVSDKMQRISNILAKTQFKFQIRDFGQLGESMKTAAASAVSAKLPLDQTATAIGLLNSAGLQGSSAGTALTAVLRSLTKASDELGTSISRDAMGNLDLPDTLAQISDALDGLDTDERNDVLQSIFGDEGRRGIVPLINNMKELADGLNEVNKAADNKLIDGEYERFLNSGTGPATVFMQNIHGIGVAFAQSLLPGINAVLTPFAKVIGFVAKGIEMFPAIGWAIGGVAAGLAIYTTGMGIATAATWLWNAALLANPVGLILVGIAAVSTAVYALYKHWDSIWDGIVGAVRKAWEYLANTPLGKLIGATTGFIGKIFSSADASMRSRSARNARNSRYGRNARVKVDEASLPLASSGSYTDQSTINISVDGSGENAEAVANKVMRKLDRKKRLQKRTRASLYDNEAQPA